MLRRLTGPFREFGAVAGSLYILGRLLNALSPRLNLFVYELTVQPIPDAPIVPDRLQKAFAIRRIMAGDPAVERMPARPEIKQSRFEQGAICLGAYRQEVLLGYVWLCRDAYDEDEVRCRYQLAPAGRAVFDFDLYIFPEYRMGRAFVGLWNGVNGYLRDHGIEYSFSRITRFNLASRRAHAHLGCRKVASAIFLQAWGVEAMVATIAPFVAVTVSPASRVGLVLAPPAKAVRSGVTSPD
jgi:hypothetical protein